MDRYTLVKLSIDRNFVVVLQNWFDIMLVFAIYTDVLIVRLRSSGFGCCVFVVYFGCLMFADDTLLTHSVLSRL